MSEHLAGKSIQPKPIDPHTSISDLVDLTFEAYNAARLREACHLFSQKILEEPVTVGLSITGALTPAGLGISCLVPLMEHGFVDWIVSTGANLYHDLHFAIGHSLHRGRPNVSDVALRNAGLIRIYDIFFEAEVLFSTDRFLREIVRAPEFQRRMGSAEFHYRLGAYAMERETRLGVPGQSLLTTAHRLEIPIYTPSPGDSGIGMNVAAERLAGNALEFDVSRDVNETAALVLHAKRGNGKSAVFILGGGSPKNFLLQTEPQLQDIFGIEEKGHDFFLQVTDARPDTGGLSGATPSEAVSWGKVNPDRLPDTVVCYLDATVALPILTAYSLANRPARPHKRLYSKIPEMMENLERATVR